MHTFTEGEGQLLLELARKTITNQLPGCSPVAPGKSLEAGLQPPCFHLPLGNFVTLKLHDNLRGCIGCLETTEPLAEGIRRNAINAALHDHRFPPLAERELDEVLIEISILSKPTPLPYNGSDHLRKILRRNIDGVVVKKGRARATFLPQVWEQLPAAEHFLSHLCLKAGLSSQAWQTDLLEISTYQVQHFSE